MQNLDPLCQILAEFGENEENVIFAISISIARYCLVLLSHAVKDYCITGIVGYVKTLLMSQCGRIRYKKCLLIAIKFAYGVSCIICWQQEMFTNLCH